MDPTSSVSKGIFIFKNNFDVSEIKTNKRRKSIKKYETDNIFSSQIWYKSYKSLWNDLDDKIQNLNKKMFSNILHNLLEYIGKCYNSSVTEIPTATILMGINQSDHTAQFSALSEKIKSEITPHVITINAEDCTTIKLFVENMVSQFVNNEENDDLESEITYKKIRNSRCTFSLLSWWYNNKYENLDERNSLVIILPKFENFHEAVLQDFILIASSYMNQLPFVLIFGVATSLSIVHKTLPYQVCSKLNIEVFSSQSSIDYLNNILDNVILTEDCQFHLGGKTFTLFTDIFLFYDFSVKGFIQNVKFAMLEHYCYGNAMALCTRPEKLDEILENFDHDDYENVRRIMSFRKFVESKNYKDRIKLISNDDFLKDELRTCILDLHDYMYYFHVLLKCLYVIVADLPNSPLGKQYREIYSTAVTHEIVETSEYKQCMQYVNFLSQDDLESKSNKIRAILKKAVKKKPSTILNDILKTMKSINSDDNLDSTLKETQNTLHTEHSNRAKLKQELLKLTKESRPKNVYEKYRENYFNTITDIFRKYLKTPMSLPFHEIFFFNNANLVKNHIVGSHRAAIHTALNNPHSYLKCECCVLSNDTTISTTFPDLSIAYKLHLESGKFINMYDWLQAFVSIADPTELDAGEERNVDPKLQARFTRAVADLEFLGFIKSSKRKTDHVQRLTWGGC